MDTEGRLDALEARAKKSSILIGVLIVLVIFISIDLKLHTVVLKLIGIDLEEINAVKSTKSAKKSKSGFDAYQLGSYKFGEDPIVRDCDGNQMFDKSMY